MGVLRILTVARMLLIARIRIPVVVPLLLAALMGLASMGLASLMGWLAMGLSDHWLCLLGLCGFRLKGVSA